MHEPRKLRIANYQCCGDATVLSAAVKALHVSNPGAFITDYQGHHRELFENNPYITHLEPWDGREVKPCYGYSISGRDGRGGSGRPFHFLSGFVEGLAKELGVYIELQDFRGDIYLSEEERQPWLGLPDKYVVIDAGRKGDFTSKFWSTHRFQQVVNNYKGRLTFVQIGSAADYHPILDGVINLVGQTSLRQLIRIVHRSSLILTPVSFPMHLAAAVPTVTGEARPCVVLMGQREPRHWESYSSHTVLGTTGKLRCGIQNGCACWLNKTDKSIHDSGNSYCRMPMADEVGQNVPECLHRITPRHVIDAIDSYQL